MQPGTEQFAIALGFTDIVSQSYGIVLK